MSTLIGLTFYFFLGIGLTFYMKWSNGHSKMYEYAVGHNFKNETNVVVVLPLCMCEHYLTQSLK